jgi:hypothetical protein
VIASRITYHRINQLTGSHFPAKRKRLQVACIQAPHLIRRQRTSSIEYHAISYRITIFLSTDGPHWLIGVHCVVRVADSFEDARLRCLCLRERTARSMPRRGQYSPAADKHQTRKMRWCVGAVAADRPGTGPRVQAEVLAVVEHQQVGVSSRMMVTVLPRARPTRILCRGTMITPSSWTRRSTDTGPVGASGVNR